MLAMMGRARSIAMKMVPLYEGRTNRLRVVGYAKVDDADFERVMAAASPDDAAAVRHFGEFALTNGAV